MYCNDNCKGTHNLYCQWTLPPWFEGDWIKSRTLISGHTGWSVAAGQLSFRAETVCKHQLRFLLKECYFATAKALRIPVTDTEWIQQETASDMQEIFEDEVHLVSLGINFTTLMTKTC